jgi:hypothetical protein
LLARVLRPPFFSVFLFRDLGEDKE